MVRRRQEETTSTRDGKKTGRKRRGMMEISRLIVVLQLLFDVFVMISFILIALIFRTNDERMDVHWESLNTLIELFSKEVMVGKLP